MQLAEDGGVRGNGHGAGRPGDPCVMVIFGASGDLTKRKLIPALYNLAKDNVLSKEFAIIGFARHESTTEELRAKLTAEMNEFATSKVDPELWNWFVERIYYVSGEFGDAAAYQKLAEQLEQVKKNHGTH